MSNSNSKLMGLAMKAVLLTTQIQEPFMIKTTF